MYQERSQRKNGKKIKTGNQDFGYSGDLEDESIAGNVGFVFKHIAEDVCRLI